MCCLSGFKGVVGGSVVGVECHKPLTPHFTYSDVSKYDYANMVANSLWYRPDNTLDFLPEWVILPPNVG